MFECRYCGLISQSERAKFCAQCGPDGPAVNWKPEEIDTRENIERYAEVVLSLNTTLRDQNNIDFFNSLRAKFIISHKAHEFIIGRLFGKGTQSSSSDDFDIYYNYDPNEAYASHDTFIEFRFHNKCDEHFFKIDLEWDDEETEDRIDLQASVTRFIAPGETRDFGTSVIFDRSGLKELVGLRLDVFDETGTKTSYDLNRLRVRIKNPSLNIQNSYSQNNSISIEGRGVIDAQGIGSAPLVAETDKGSENWIPLKAVPFVDICTITNDTIEYLQPHIEPNILDQEPILDIQNQEVIEAEIAVEAAPVQETREEELDLSSFSLELDVTQSSSSNKIILTANDKASTINLRIDVLCKSGDVLKLNVTDVLRISYGERQVILKSPINGVYRFTQVNSSPANSNWTASVDTIDIENLSVQAILRNDILCIEDFPTELNLSVSRLNSTISPDGIIGAVYCRDFNKQFDITVGDQSYLSGLKLFPLTKVFEPVDGIDRTGVAIAKIASLEMKLYPKSLETYFDDKKISLKRVNFSDDIIYTPDTKIVDVIQGFSKFSLVSNFPVKLLAHPTENSYVLQILGAEKSSAPLLTVKDPRSNTAVIQLSDYEKVETHYIELENVTDASKVEFIFQSSVSEVVIDDGAIICEAEGDLGVVKIASNVRGYLSFIRHSKIGAKSNFLYEIITNEIPNKCHRYYYKLAPKAPISKLESQASTKSSADTSNDVVKEILSNNTQQKYEANEKEKRHNVIWALIGLATFVLIMMAIQNHVDTRISKFANSYNVTCGNSKNVMGNLSKFKFDNSSRRGSFYLDWNNGTDGNVDFNVTSNNKLRYVTWSSAIGDTITSKGGLVKSFTWPDSGWCTKYKATMTR